jgi:hypothetical protein
VQSDYWFPFIAELVALQIASILGSISRPRRKKIVLLGFPITLF